MTEYVAWLGLDRRSIDEKDVLSGGIERLNLASAGFLTKAEGATTQVTPILLTSPQAMQIAADKFSGVPDPVALLRAYKPEGKPLMLAARIAGTANSAYPDGVPKPVKAAADDKSKPDAAKPEGAKPDAAKPAEPKPEAAKDDAKPKDDKPAADAAAKPHKASGRINAIVVADTDLLSDQFWVDVRDFLGQQVADPQRQQRGLRRQRARQPVGLGCADRAARARRRGPAVQARQRPAPRVPSAATARRSRR